MKIGDKVKCVKNYNGSEEWLTAGKVYDVAEVFYGGAFLLHGNGGEELFCIYPDCAFAKWEQVK